MRLSKQQLIELNTPEPRNRRIKRLMREAVNGVKHNVSLREAMEFFADRQMLNQGEVAKLLGLSDSHYSEFMRGKRGLPIKALRRAYALGVPAVALLQTTSTSKP